MSLRSVKPLGETRVAVVGAPTIEGAHVREALAERGVQGSRVDLYGTTRGEVVLSEYAGEARMIQEPDVGEVASHELIFICEMGELAAELTRAAPSSVVIDLRDSLPSDVRPKRVPLEIGPDVVRGDGRFAVPHPLALVLGEVLHPLERRFGLAEAMAVVLRPAADYGPEGVEELRQQTVCLLNFARVPQETFGRQLAFNIIPEARLAGGQRGLERRIEGEVADLLGRNERPFTVRLVTAPVFHGHSLQLRFRLKKETAIDEVRGALAESGLLDDGSDGTAATPLDLTGDARTAVSDLSEDGLGAFWLWGVAGEAGSRSAQQAVRLAAALFDF
jgi:aspartate-semialdehyde dehydrogenase